MLLLASGALLLSGCAMTPPEAEPATGMPGQCDAAANQSLIGKQVGAVSFPAGANVRVVCTTCPTTRDYRPDRMNVRFDQATGVIEKVDCG